MADPMIPPQGFAADANPPYGDDSGPDDAMFLQLVTNNDSQSEKRGDVVYTPDWVARDMCAQFKPTGRVLDPCRGEGVFERHLADDITFDWCEIRQGRDFFDWHEPVDWVISNPPYSLTRKWFRHSMTIAENLVYLVPLRNVFSGYGFLREIHDFGGIAAIRVYGTGGRLGFPMGNAVGAMHVARNHTGRTRITHYDDLKEAA